MEKRRKSALESGALILIVAAILVAVNALSALGGYRRIDTTKNERFTLSRGSGNLLRSMKQELTVDAYVTKGLPKLDAFVRDLRDLLNEYKRAAPDKFDFQIIEAKDEDTKKKAKDAGLTEQPFGEASETETKAAVTQGFMGLVFHYGEQQDKIPFLPPDRTDGLEFWLTNKIRELRDKGDNIHHKIGVLTGHDEMKLTENNLVPSNVGKYNLQGIITQNFPFYTFQDVDLKGGDSAISDDLDGLIILQPAKDITDKELHRIDEFVMKGKSLVAFVSSVNIKANDASMNASLNAHGLDKLFEGYGMELRRDAVLDMRSPLRLLVPTQAGVASAAFPQFPQVVDDPRYTGDEQLIDTGFPPFFRMEGVVVPFASSIITHNDKQPDANTCKGDKNTQKICVVARTTPKGVRMTGDSADLNPFQQWKVKAEGDKKGQFNLGAYVEGTLRTAFPEGDKMGIEVPDKSVKPARVFLLASSQFLANPLARAGNGPDMPNMGMMMPNMGGDEKLLMLATPYAQSILTTSILGFKNTLDWLSGDTDLLAVSAKILSEPSLAYTDIKIDLDSADTEEEFKKRADEMKNARTALQTRVEGTLTVGVPLLFVILGIARWRWRVASRSKLALS